MESRQRLIEMSVAACIGFAVGHFGADSSREFADSTKITGKDLNEPSRSSVSISDSNSTSETPGIANAGWQPSGLMAKLKLTQEDVEKTITLNLAREKGEYVLRNERPTTKKFLEQDFTEIVAQEKENRTSDYDKVFAELGVAPEVAEQIKNHAAKIHRASLETEVTIDQLLTARQDYDKRLRESLGEDGYNRYRQYEAAKPAMREVGEFKNFVENQSLAFDVQQEAQLQALMQQAQAYTSESWIGPYDQMHLPQLGYENVLATVQAEKAQITTRANQLLAQAAQAGLPEEYQDLLANYYTAKVNEKQKVIDAMNQPSASSTPSPNPTNPNPGGK